MNHESKVFYLDYPIAAIEKFQRLDMKINEKLEVVVLLVKED